ncbi:MAG TPA: amidohydrolase [Candidatus Ratteibacteria bacterium]|nr:amidohydrolase [bacterium]HRR95738.1 amidohydrolase [Candidatus Ratteibacteria bacterium]
MEDLKNKVKEIEKDIISWYRYFHQYPEIGFQEFRTSEKIQSLLKKFKIPYQVKAKTGVVGYLKGKGKKTIGIRSDIDALPVEEKTSLPYKSKNKGYMHACGHDGHIAILLGIAKVLSEMEDDLGINFKFIFQPSEEAPPSGAKQMIEEGVIDDVNLIIGYHLFSFLPFKKLWIGKGPVMANADSFKIKINGKGGHGSRPHLTNDPITCAGYLITSLQTIVSRKIDPVVPCVVSFGKISGGFVFNVIPDEVEIIGTVRTLSEDIRDKIKDEIEKITEKICSLFGCKYEVEYNKHSPVNVNDESLSEKIIKITQKYYPESLCEFHPIMGGEDFAFYSQKIPSCYMFIGMGEKCGQNHNSSFKIDERILPFAVEYLTTILINLNNPCC